MGASAQTQPPNRESKHGILWVVWEFAIHGLVGTLIFATVAGGAAGIELLNHALQGMRFDAYIGYGLKFGEYAVFTTDLSLFLVFLPKAWIRAVRKM
jgi:hypothetical protein